MYLNLCNPNLFFFKKLLAKKNRAHPTGESYGVANETNVYRIDLISVYAEFFL